MNLTFDFFLFAIPAVLIAGVSKGGFGSGPAFAASPFLALILPPSEAVGVMLPLLMIGDVSAIPSFWKKWSLPDARAMMVGAIPGVFAGYFFFNMVDANALKVLIGSISVGFVAFQLARAAGVISDAAKPFSNGRAGFWGVVAGFTSFVSHAGGPPAAMHFLSRKLDKTTFQATTLLVFLWINIIKVPPYIALGMIGTKTLYAVAALAPVMFIGIRIGIWAHYKVPEKLFFRLAYVFLTIVGSKLIYDGLSS